MTVYRGMDIGTDKPARQGGNDKAQMTNDKGVFIIDRIPHHMLDILDPDEEFNAAIFKEKVTKLVHEIQKRGNVPFLVGGSLLYIDSYVYNFQMPQVEPDEKLRTELEKKSSEELFKKLVELDPDAEWVVDKNNRRRLIRALEVCMNSGKPFTSQRTKKILPANVLYLAVESERDDLYGKINERVDEMMKEGFLDEVKKLYKKYDHSTAMQATGYRQLISYIEGEITLEEAVEQTKKSHRNFAKRQLTWLRANPDVSYVRAFDDSESKLSNFLKIDN
jgi:tRNA dimethylallyltransferase